MISRIATIGLIGLLAVALIGGSAYILLRPDDEAVARAAGPYNRSDSAAGQRGDGYQGGRGAQGRFAGSEGGNGYQGGGGVGQGRQAGSGTLGEGLADDPVETWKVISGTVFGLEDDELTIDTGDGAVTVHLGPEWYWETEGISFVDGDQIQVSGFYEDDTFEVGSIENLTAGQSVTLRNETGRPLWAGRGRQAQEQSLAW
jgi:hypothetical protein